MIFHRVKTTIAGLLELIETEIPVLAPLWSLSRFLQNGISVSSPELHFRPLPRESKRSFSENGDAPSQEKVFAAIVR
jgi:hypothetical protein